MPTFAGVNMEKRHIASWVLLAVFVPMVVLSSVHVHERTDNGANECNECVRHHCHGHLAKLAPSMQDCVFCQFLTLTMLAVAVATINIYQKSQKKTSARRQRTVFADGRGIPTLRAPPAV